MNQKSFLGTILPLFLFVYAIMGCDFNADNHIPPSPVIFIPNPENNINVSGNLSFERPLPFLSGGLNYSNIQIMPIRGVIVQLLKENDNLLAETVSNEQGNYLFSLAEESPTLVKIRVLAEIQDPAPVRIVDQNISDALYSFESSLTNPITTNFNFIATTGFDGTGYSGLRLSAPFAILDTILTTLQTIVEAKPNLQSMFIATPLIIEWSPDNNNGAFFTPKTKRIYLAGEEDVDTNEFDQSVIVHEWGHYLQDVIGRSDNTGGGHCFGEQKDMRLAFNEGYGNALTGMILETNIYSDSSGFQQSNGFSLDLEDNLSDDPTPGWFSETSVMHILFDLFDADPDGVDSINLGLKPLIDVLEADVTNQVFISIFSFIDLLKEFNPSSATAIDTLTNSLDINNVMDEFATGETNDGGFLNNLPVYKSAVIDGSAINLDLRLNNGCDIPQVVGTPFISNQLDANKYITFVGNGSTLDINYSISGGGTVYLFLTNLGLDVINPIAVFGNGSISFSSDNGERYVLNIRIVTFAPDASDLPLLYTAIISITS